MSEFRHHSHRVTSLGHWWQADLPYKSRLKGESGSHHFIGSLAICICFILSNLFNPWECKEDNAGGKDNGPGIVKPGIITACSYIDGT